MKDQPAGAEGDANLQERKMKNVQAGEFDLM